MTLRTDLFPTVNRGTTQFIAVRDTLTRADEAPETNAQSLDMKHCSQGRFGIGYHFLILTNGVIQLCRRIGSCGNHSRNLDDVSVAVGIVGGADEEGNRVHTRTDEQDGSLEGLLGFLGELYPDAVVHDRPANQYP